MAPRADALAGDATEDGGLIRLNATAPRRGADELMRRFSLAVPMLAAVVLAAPLPALAPAALAADRADMQRGEMLVRRHCAACHAVGPTGASPNTAAPAFRDLHSRYQIDDLAEGLAEGLLTGHPAMPEFEFSPPDVQAIIVYLKSIQTRQGATLPRAQGR